MRRRNLHRAAGPWSSTVLILLLLLFPARLFAGNKSDCNAGKCADIQCAGERTFCLLDEGRADEALGLLKKELPGFADSSAFHLLMARAYLALENRFWAVNTLSGYLDRHPDDCEVKSWLVWLMIQGGDLKEAGSALSGSPECAEGKDAIASRFAMIETFLHIQQEEQAGKDGSKVQEKKKIQKVFPEDLSLQRFNRSILHPNHVMPLTIKTEMGAGYTTNALMGSPSDPESSGKMYSPLILNDVYVNFTPPVWEWINPMLEITAKGILFTREDGSDNYPRQLSYLDASVRPGFVLFKERYPRLVLAYKGNFLFINKPTAQEEAPVYFYEGHRGEFELEANPHLTLFGGAGKRLFDQMARTRLEFDGGAGAGWTIRGRLTLLGAVTLRYFKAENEAYNDFGVSGLIAANFQWWKGTKIRVLLSLSMDNYMDSVDYFADGKRRKDTIIKVVGSIFSPAWKGLRAGLVYEYSKKYSTIDAYAYEDVRVMVKLQWYYAFDLFRPKKTRDKSHVPLDYGLGTGGGAEVSDKIQDLLRQEESFTRGSSCKD
ncbi:MAG: porin family protein [Pseudomonadota bacterium]